MRTAVDFRNRADRVPPLPGRFAGGFVRARPAGFAPRPDDADEIAWFHDNRRKLRSTRFVTTFTATAPTFSTPIAAATVASSATAGVGTTVTLDLTTKFGAWLHCRIGRTVATALTTAAPPYLGIRRQVNNTLVHPATNYDFIGSVAAVNATTLATTAISIGDTLCTLTSATGFAQQQTCCFATSPRFEFWRIGIISTTAARIDRATSGFRVAHSIGDTVTNGADVGSVWIPGGDIWEFTTVNMSGQTVVMAMDAAVYASDTGT